MPESVTGIKKREEFNLNTFFENFREIAYVDYSGLKVNTGKALKKGTYLQTLFLILCQIWMMPPHVQHLKKFGTV